MNAKKNRVAFACVFFLWVTACAVGGRHTPDSRMEENFILQEAGFEALLAEVNADDKLEMLRVDAVRYAGRDFSDRSDPSGLEHLGFAREHWGNYKQKLRKLGIAQITRREGGVEFRVDAGTFSNGDSYKGYEYSLTPPGRRETNLDQYRISEVDRDRFGNYFVCKPIKGNWYLYLFVNG
jgi:hypothetical protein